MKRGKKKTVPESQKQVEIHGNGILVITDNNSSELYRYSSPAQRKSILREHINDKCKEFRTEDYSKAEEYRSEMQEKVQIRKYPIGYIAVRSGQHKGVYPYVDSEERFKIMNKYHKYEIRDFGHFLFRKNAEEWSEFGNTEHNTTLVYTGCHNVLKKLFSEEIPAKFSGTISNIESGNLFFDKLEVHYNDHTETETAITIYNPEIKSEYSIGQHIQFYAEACRFLNENNETEYGIYKIFDLNLL